MTTCHQKAIELGNLIVASEISMTLADARANFDADTEAVKAYDQYMEHQKSIQIAANSGLITAEQYQEALTKLVEMEINLKSRPAVQEYLKAEQEYKDFIDSVLAALKATVGISSKSPCGGCGGKSKSSCCGK